jgi:hypothetical protein
MIKISITQKFNKKCTIKQTLGLMFPFKPWGSKGRIMFFCVSYSLYKKNRLPSILVNRKVLSVRGKFQGKTKREGPRYVINLLYTSTGQFNPPILICLKVKINERSMQSTRLENVTVLQQNGWKNSEIFLLSQNNFWGSHPSSENLLLITDNDSNHKDRKSSVLPMLSKPTDKIL